MKTILPSVLALSLIASGPVMAATEKISLPLTAGLSRADIYIIPAMTRDPAGTLILCPGHNGDGEEMVNNFEWSYFGKKQNLNLVGISFASPDDSQDRGYFKAESGSGEILLEGLQHAFGSKQAPLFFYGFSRGAQFAYTFSCWKPNLVEAWCAYSATEWDSSEHGLPGPNGIIACGDEDEPNYSSATFEFLQGRSLAKAWTWISLPRTGHVSSSSLEAFVRAYFASILLHPKSRGLWLDVETKNSPTPAELQDHPTLAAWLPDQVTANLWKKLHQP